MRHPPDNLPRHGKSEENKATNAKKRF